MTRRRWVVAVLLAALALVAGGCSGDDDSEQDAEDASDQTDGDEAPGGDASREAYVTAFGDTLQVVMTNPDDRRCMGEAVVDVVGLATLQAAGTPEDVTQTQGTLRAFGVQLDEPTADALYDAFEACIDLRTLLFTDEGSGPELLACLETDLPSDVLRDYLVSTWLSEDGQTPDPTVQDQLSTVYNGCVAAVGDQPSPTDGS